VAGLQLAMALRTSVGSPRRANLGGHLKTGALSAGHRDSSREGVEGCHPAEGLSRVLVIEEPEVAPDPGAMHQFIKISLATARRFRYQNA
jgi:hypothetical protein